MLGMYMKFIHHWSLILDCSGPNFKTLLGVVKTGLFGFWGKKYGVFFFFGQFLLVKIVGLNSFSFIMPWLHLMQAKVFILDNYYMSRKVQSGDGKFWIL